MATFKSDLKVTQKGDDKIWILNDPLEYGSDIAGKVVVPAQFETDFASVPRIPIVWLLFGDRAHREAVIHDYLYRIDSKPEVSRETADEVFFEAMTVRGKSAFVRYAMYWGVRLGGGSSYHKKKVSDIL